MLSGGAASGAGIAPTRIEEVVGITKAYATRVGGGPFPTELTDELGDRIRNAGGEFGSVTGRPRRCGWLDIPVLRHAVRMNGVTELAITKLDVLSGISPVRIAVGYAIDGHRHDHPPALGVDRARPIFEDLPGWTEDLRGIRTFDALPLTVQRFVLRVEELVGAKIGMISVGPDREETISVSNPHTHHMKVDYSAWEGFKVKGYPDTVFSRGRCVVHKGEQKASGGGQFVKRALVGSVLR